MARQFNAGVGLTGLVLAKMDSDTRGGASLSIRAETGCPVLFCGTGEHMEDFEPFYPDRMASRILQMGDIVSLVEKVQEQLSSDEAAKTQERLFAADFGLDDFLVQLRQMRRMGPIENLLDMLPMGARFRGSTGIQAGGGEEFARFARKSEAIVQSMTPAERRRPEIVSGSRRRRIAGGSGTTVADVNDLLRRFSQARKMAKQLKGLGKKGLLQRLR